MEAADDTAAPTRRLHPVLSSALARGFALVPTAVATLLTSRIIFEHFDERVFNGYTLLLSTMVLLPLNSLGVGAAVTNAFAAFGPQDQESRRTVRTAARILTLSTIGVAAVALAISAADGWDALLGEAAVTGPIFGVGIAIYAVSFVPGLGQNMLLGVNRNTLSILLQALWAPASLALVLLVVHLDLEPNRIVIIPAVTLTALMIVNAWVSARVTKFPWARTLRAIPRRKRWPGTPIRAIAGPALIAQLAVPILLHSDRIVLSHTTSEQQLAKYGVSWQLFTPLLALIIAAAQPVWPLYTKARTEGTAPPSMPKLMLLFGGLAAALSGGICLAARPLGGLVSGDEVELGIVLPLANALVVVMQAVAAPLGMALMDGPGLRLGARLCIIAVPLNLGASIVLAQQLGAPGPLFASAAVGLFVQTAPAVVHLRRRAATGSSQPPPASVAEAQLPVVTPP